MPSCGQLQFNPRIFEEITLLCYVPGELNETVFVKMLKGGL